MQCTQTYFIPHVAQLEEKVGQTLPAPCFRFEHQILYFLSGMV